MFSRSFRLVWQRSRYTFHFSTHITRSVRLICFNNRDINLLSTLLSKSIYIFYHSSQKEAQFSNKINNAFNQDFVNFTGKMFRYTKRRCSISTEQ